MPVPVTISDQLQQLLLRHVINTIYCYSPYNRLVFAYALTRGWCTARKLQEDPMSTSIVTGALIAATIAAPVLTILMVIANTPAFAG